MAEKPIIFNGESIRAILNGRKTQTRRVIKPQPVLGRPWKTWTIDPEEMDIPRAYCPYGIRSDHLWVRETWAASAIFDDRKPSEIMLEDTSLWYKAGGFRIFEGDVCGKWHPSIFMPRLFSRITLEVKSVRVERMQEISNVDARAEGIIALRDERDLFAQLWDSINAKRGFSWESNPWVWVVDFGQVKQ